MHKNTIFKFYIQYIIPNMIYFKIVKIKTIKLNKLCSKLRLIFQKGSFSMILFGRSNIFSYSLVWCGVVWCGVVCCVCVCACLCGLWGHKFV